MMKLKVGKIVVRYFHSFDFFLHDKFLAKSLLSYAAYVTLKVSNFIKLATHTFFCLSNEYSFIY